MIKSIPTRYNGIDFKSKLEATWAKWLDKKEIAWSYESEGFDLDGEWYLPDFFLTEMNIILEIKGAIQGIDKINRLAKKLHEKNKGLDHNDMKHPTLEPKYLLLMGGSPVPRFYYVGYPIGGGVCWKKCLSCGKIFLFLDFHIYNCRICGCYAEGRTNSLYMLSAPFEWEFVEKQFISKELKNRQPNDFIDPQKEFYEHGKFVPKYLAKHIQQKYRFATPGINSDIYRYIENRGIWIPDGERVIREVAASLLGTKELRYYITEVIWCIKNSTYVDRKLFGR